MQGKTCDRPSKICVTTRPSTTLRCFYAITAPMLTYLFTEVLMIVTSTSLTASGLLWAGSPGTSTDYAREAASTGFGDGG
jgi:hypothetical protein